MSTPAIPPPPTLPRGRASRYDAIVVGSGVGGCVTAALLAHAGRRVLVLEKNASVGGILASYTYNGFKIDRGSHLVARGARGPLGRVLRRAGLSRPRFLTHPFLPMRTRGILDAALPRERWRLLPAALRIFRDLGVPASEARGLARLGAALLTLRGDALRAWDRRSLDELVRTYTSHPAAYFALGFLASIFFVLPPWDASAGESIRCLRRVALDWSLSYVEGGMDAYPHALLSRVVAAGGEIVTGRRAVAIRPVAHGLRVATDDGAEYDAPAVACNVAPQDLPALVERLPPEYAARLRAIAPAGNAHQVKLALARPLVREGCFIGGVSVGGLRVADLSIDMMRGVVDALAAGRIADPTPVYAPVPTSFDPTLAPPGRQLIVASIYAGTGDRPADSTEAWRTHCLRVLARAIPGLEADLLFADFAPIPAIGGWMGRSGRAAIANGQRPGQVGADRLPVATPVPGLFLCGDGAGGHGIGMELAATSGEEAAAAILAGAAAHAPRGVAHAA